MTTRAQQVHQLAQCIKVEARICALKRLANETAQAFDELLRRTGDGSEPMVNDLLDDARLVARDYERMMAEARIAFAGDADRLAVASVLAEKIACNPNTRINWDTFLALNRR